MRSSLRKLLVTGLGTGYMPLAPGSWGSAAVAGIFLLAAWASGGNAWCVNLAMLAVAGAFSVICVRLGRFTEEAFGKKDPGQNTADEWAGQAVSLLLMPLGAGWDRWLIVTGVSFFLFRLFDSVKPTPLRRLEKLPYGWGVLMDDLAAGVYANLATQLALRLWLLK